jgi:triacylglycerol lipase
MRMSYVIAATELMSAAATDLATIGSDLSAAHAAAAPATTGIVAAAQDEVSSAIAALFSAHGQGFQALGAQATAFHDQFVAVAKSGAGSYASTEAANLAGLGNTLLSDVVASSPVIPVGALKTPTFTGTPSLLNQVETALLRPVNSLLTVTGFWNQFGVLGSPVQNLFSSGLLSRSSATPRPSC